jgi:hypothetical protein
MTMLILSIVCVMLRIVLVTDADLPFQPSACPYFSSTATIAYPNKTANFDRIVGKFLGEGGIIGEDCLTLNVWSKHAASTEPGKPVMVFFYGGSGDTHMPFHSPPELTCMCRVRHWGHQQLVLQRSISR